MNSFASPVRNSCTTHASLCLIQIFSQTHLILVLKGIYSKSKLLNFQALSPTPHRWFCTFPSLDLLFLAKFGLHWDSNMSVSLYHPRLLTELSNRCPTTPHTQKERPENDPRNVVPTWEIRKLHQTFFSSKHMENCTDKLSTFSWISRHDNE